MKPWPAFVGHRVILPAAFIWGGVRKCGVDPRVIAAYMPKRSLDARHRIFLRWPAIKDKSCGQIRTIGGEAERLASAPAEARNKEFAARSRELQRVIGCGIQVCSHLVRIQMADGLHRFVARKIRAAAAVRAHAGEQVGSDRDVAGRGDLIREVLHPVRHSKYFMDD